MKSILISIKPKYVAEILNGRKTIEIRKSCPKCDLPCEVYIYCTNGREVLKPNKINPQYRKIKAYSIKKGCVCAKFTLNKVEKIKCYDIGFGVRYCVPNNDPRDYPLCEKSCLTQEELNAYLKEKDGYAWHIDNLVIFDKPKELREFGVKRSPQSWQFIEVDE